MGNDVCHVRVVDLDLFRSLFETQGIDLELACFADSAIRRSGFPFSPDGPFGTEGELFGRFFTGMKEQAASTTVWTVDLDRNFASLDWVLASAAAVQDAKQLAYKSTFGNEVLELDLNGRKQVARGGQGFAVRVSTTAACQQVADFLSGVSPEDLHQYVDISQMQDLYKMRPDDDHQELGDRLVRYLSDLTFFYNDVAESGHSVVVCRD